MPRLHYLKALNIVTKSIVIAIVKFELLSSIRYLKLVWYDMATEYSYLIPR